MRGVELKEGVFAEERPDIEEIKKRRITKIVSIGGEEISLIVNPLSGLSLIIDNPAEQLREQFVTRWTEKDVLCAYKAHQKIAERFQVVTGGLVDLGFSLSISPFGPGGHYENSLGRIVYDICFKTVALPFPAVQEAVAAHEAGHALLVAPIIPVGNNADYAQIFEHDLGAHPFVVVPDFVVPAVNAGEAWVAEKLTEMMVIKIARKFWPVLPSGADNLNTFFAYTKEIIEKMNQLVIGREAKHDLIFVAAMEMINGGTGSVGLGEDEKRTSDLLVRCYEETRVKQLPGPWQTL